MTGWATACYKNNTELNSTLSDLTLMTLRRFVTITKIFIPSNILKKNLAVAYLNNAELFGLKNFIADE